MFHFYTLLCVLLTCMTHGSALTFKCQQKYNYYIHHTENKDRQFDNFVVIGGTLSCHYDKIVKIEGIFGFRGPVHVFVVGVLLDNMHKPDDFTAAIINTLYPNELLMSDID